MTRWPCPDKCSDIHAIWAAVLRIIPPGSFGTPVRDRGAFRRGTQGWFGACMLANGTGRSSEVDPEAPPLPSPVYSLPVLGS
eukprot:3799868-Alexandrium_andersonii.AAC.1